MKVGSIETALLSIVASTARESIISVAPRRILESF